MNQQWLGVQKSSMICFNPTSQSSAIMTCSQAEWLAVQYNWCGKKNGSPIKNFFEDPKKAYEQYPTAGEKYREKKPSNCNWILYVFAPN